jgi:hypothetical protein
MRSLHLVVLLCACENTNSKGLQRGQNASAIAVGARHACAIVADKTLRCFGDNAAGQLGGAPASGTDDAGAPSEVGTGAVIVTGLTSVTEVTAGNAHTCARTGDGVVRCWGANDFGQLGDTTTTSRATPVILPALRNARALSAGGAHTCAILENKTVLCWGRNDDGQLGDGSTTMRPTPVQVAGLSDVEELAAGTFHTCARLVDLCVRCWGRNDAGQIGDGTSGTPRRIATNVVGLPGAVRSITTALSDSCALLADNTIHCWGRAIGRPSATPVIGFPLVSELVMGASPTTVHLCGRLPDASIRCTTTLNQTPRLVPGIVNAVDISVGAEQACARLADGAVRCWLPNGEPFPIIL